MPALRTRMTARNTTEAHRASSPLELLFDLTFVVAIAQIAAELAHSIEEGHALAQLGPFLMVLFAIWWAWMNFTWFASAYDTDDVPYRLLTLLQMGGVLVLAAGVPAAFADQNFLAVTIGYLIMRIGLVAQWLRAAIQHPEGRTTALRYAIGITVVQAIWFARLAIPEVPWWTFVIAALLDLAVPPWAERTGTTAWHPHHIAERYGLFTIILLGESVLASTAGVKDAVTNGVTLELIAIAVSGLVLLFGLWWIYFLEPAGEGLEKHRERSFFWGYGHYGIFAALAALGAGLEVAVASTGHEELHASVLTIGYAIAIPVAVILLLLWILHVPIVEQVVVNPIAIGIVVVVVLAVPLLIPSVPVVLAIIAIAVATLVATTLFLERASR
jgi:low temperature requirement protein LtrA